MELLHYLSLDFFSYFDYFLLSIELILCIKCKRGIRDFCRFEILFGH